MKIDLIDIVFRKKFGYAYSLLFTKNVNSRYWKPPYEPIIFYQAIQYMMDNTGMDRERIESEIDRYSVLPGQACSYKVRMCSIF